MSDLQLDDLENSDEADLPLEALEEKPETSQDDAIASFALGLGEGINPLMTQNIAKTQAAIETDSPESIINIARPEASIPGLVSFEESQPEFIKAKSEKLAELEGIQEQSPVASMAGSVASLVVPSPMDLMFGSLSSGVASRLKDLAERRAFKSTGAMKKITSKTSPEKQMEIGRTLLDEGIITKIPKTKEGMLDLVESKLDEVGESLGSTVDKLSEFEQRAASGAFAGDQIISPLGAVIQSGKTGLKRDMILGDALERSMPVMGVPGASARLEKLTKAAEEFEGFNPEFISIKDAETLRRAIGKDLEKRGIWKKLKMGMGDMIEPYDELNVALYDNLSRGVLDGAEYLAKHHGSPIKSGEITKLKSTYSNLKTSRQALQDRIASESSNRTISPSDYMSGVGGVVAGGTPLEKAAFAGAAALTNKVLRNFGNPIVAKYSDLTSKFINIDPRKFGKFAPIISGAQSAPRAVSNQIIGSLMNDPEFSQISSGIDTSYGIAIDPSDIPAIQTEILKQVKDPIKRAKMINKLTKEGKLIYPGELE